MDQSQAHPRRPPRMMLLQGVRPFYFVTFNTARRMRILDNPSVHGSFVKFCKRAWDERGVAVGRYVLMPDHIHLFVVMPRTGLLLTGWVQSMKSVLGKKLLEHGIEKPHWQEGFFDHVMRNSDSYGQKWEYVRQNPVRAGLCQTMEEWPWQGEIVRLSF
jgi:putative transposase